MAFAVTDIIAAQSNAFAPSIIIEFAVEFYVGPPEPHPFAVDAGEIGFAADARAITDV